MRFGEDIDFSIRIFKNGYTCRLFPDAWVYHKRRTDLKKFFKQVHNSGIARINLYKKYPDSLKLVHLLPAVFTLGVALLLLGSLFCLFSFTPIILYALLVCIDSTIQNKSLSIGVYSIAAAFIQLIGYGTGFGAHGGSVVSEGRMSLRLSKRIFISNPFFICLLPFLFLFKRNVV